MSTIDKISKSAPLRDRISLLEDIIESYLRGSVPFATVLESFIQPAVGGQVEVKVSSAGWLQAGQLVQIFIEGPKGGFYEVIEVVDEDLLLLELTNKGVSTASGLIIPANAKLTVSSQDVIEIPSALSPLDVWQGYVTGNPSFIWIREKNSGPWNPLDTTIELTATFFKRGSYDIVDNNTVLTLDPSTGNITVSGITQNGISRTESGNGTPNVLVTFTHIDSGVKISQAVAAIQGGDQGVKGDTGGDGINGNAILSGTEAPALELGALGDYYMDVVTNNLYGPKSGAGWGTPVLLVGPSGNAILNGSGAPSNGLGADGDYYLDTVNINMYGPKEGGVWPAGFSLVGPAGGDGIDGNTIISGTGVPDNGVGSDGDYFIDTNAYNVYGPKAGGVWGAGSSLVGPSGGDGIDGNTIISGTGAPNNGLGINGDYYQDTNAKLMYGPKEGGVWPAGFSLVGPGGGRSVLNGDGPPAPGTGIDNDFYIDTTNDQIYGPKTSSAWGAGKNLIGPQGPGGLTILNGDGAPAGGLGNDGDFYIDTTNDQIYGPKDGTWGDPKNLVGPPGADGADGYTILNGDGAPAGGLGKDGDFYIDTTNDRMFGPKTAGNWGAPKSLIGPPGDNGGDGIDGNTILTGTGAPSNGLGVDGDYYVDNVAANMYGPKAGGTWPAGFSLVGPAGGDGIDGNTIISGTGAPSNGVGVNGDYFLSTDLKLMYGPKAGGAWSAGFNLVGADGGDGIDGNTILSGTGVPGGGLGSDGDYYQDTNTKMMYGPKAGGAWPAGFSLVGPGGGRSVLHGSGAPDPGTGIDDDFYIDTTNDQIYGPKTSGAWGAGRNLVGPQGADGLTVRSGLGAPNGGIGNNGDFYIDTTNDQIYGPKASGVWPSPKNLVGPSGADGIDGKSMLNGDGAPSSSLGNNGDFYLDTTNDRLYGPKSGGVWDTPKNLVGPAGVDGLTLLNGSGPPTSGVGKDGDFYIDTTNDKLYGPKAGGIWLAGKSLIGPPGDPGIPGPGILVRGAYNAGSTYYHASDRRDVVTHNGNWYRTNNPVKNATATWGTPGGVDWVLWPNFSMVATELLLAEDAAITKTLTIGEAGSELGAIKSYDYTDADGLQNGWLIKKGQVHLFNSLILLQDSDSKIEIAPDTLVVGTKDLGTQGAAQVTGGRLPMAFFRAIASQLSGHHRIGLEFLAESRDATDNQSILLQVQNSDFGGLMRYSKLMFRENGRDKIIIETGESPLYSGIRTEKKPFQVRAIGGSGGLVQGFLLGELDKEGDLRVYNNSGDLRVLCGAAGSGGYSYLYDAQGNLRISIDGDGGLQSIVKPIQVRSAINGIILGEIDATGAGKFYSPGGSLRIAIGDGGLQSIAKPIQVRSTINGTVLGEIDATGAGKFKSTTLSTGSLPVTRDRRQSVVIDYGATTQSRHTFTVSHGFGVTPTTGFISCNTEGHVGGYIFDESNSTTAKFWVEKINGGTFNGGHRYSILLSQ